MSWSAEQQRLLSAMGYTLYRPASAVPANAGPAGRVSVAESVAVVAAPVAPAADQGTSHRLRQALQRAAAGRDVEGLVGDLEALRRDPLKKRALWPRLRALRRPH